MGSQLIRYENCAKIRWAQTTPKHKMRTIHRKGSRGRKGRRELINRGWTRMIADRRRRSAWDKPTDPRSGDPVIGASGDRKIELSKNRIDRSQARAPAVHES